MKAEKNLPQQPDIILTLSWDEAITLRTVAGNCTGSPATSRRKHTDDLYDKLRVLGVPTKSHELHEEENTMQWLDRSNK